MGGSSRDGHVCVVYVLLQVCTFSTPNHIAWMVPIMPQSYYLTG